MWADTDASGRIYFAAIFRWVEFLETGLFRSIGSDLNKTGHFPRVHVEADYRLPLGFDDEVEMEMWVDKLGTKSLTYKWEGRHNGEIAFEGSHTVVYLAPDGLSAPLPDRERALLDPST